MKKYTALALCGSLRAESLNFALLHAIKRVASPELEVAIGDRITEVPVYNQDHDDSVPGAVAAVPPRSVELLRSELARADAIILASPEYNASISGPVQNLLNWASRPLLGKPVLVVVATPNASTGVAALAATSEALRIMGAVVIEPGLIINGADHVISGRGPDAVLEEGLAGMASSQLSLLEAYLRLDVAGIQGRVVQDMRTRRRALGAR